MSVRHLRIIGSGQCLPERKVDSEEIDRKLGLSAGSSLRSSGVKTRYFANAERETVSRMGARAARSAVDAAGLSFKDVSAIVFASGVPQQSVPYTASLVQKEIGREASGIPCFDVNTTCLSFVAALDLFSYPMCAGRFERVLIVSAENASIGLDPEDLHTYSLFGDGACAFLIERTDRATGSTVLATGLETYSEGADHCRLLGGGSGVHPRQYGQPGMEKAFFFQMNGLATIKIAKDKLPPFVDRLLDSASLKLSDIDLVVPHQASRAGMEILRRRLDIPDERWMDVLEEYGNMISVSIPLALRQAILRNRIQRGNKVLLLGTSAGFSVGGAILTY